MRKRNKIFISVISILVIVGVIFDVVTTHFWGSLTVALMEVDEDKEAHAYAIDTGYALNQEVESSEMRIKHFQSLLQRIRRQRSMFSASDLHILY